MGNRQQERLTVILSVDSRAARRPVVSIRDDVERRAREISSILGDLYIATIGNEGVVLQWGAPRANPKIDCYFDVDDSIQSLEIQSNMVRIFGDAFVLVRLRQDGTKDGKEAWEREDDELDLRERPLSGEELALELIRRGMDRVRKLTETISP